MSGVQIPVAPPFIKIMVSIVNTASFQGAEPIAVQVQAQFSNGLPSFNIVGLADKSITESKERIRSALLSIGLSLPSKRITINLSPANVKKFGSHYDVAIVLAILVETGFISQEEINDYIVMGEIGLDGSIKPVTNILSACMHAVDYKKNIILPYDNMDEASLVDNISIVAVKNLFELIDIVTGKRQRRKIVKRKIENKQENVKDFKDVLGQKFAKRALEICAIGGHNLLMIGPPGSGKSMLAERLPSIMMPLCIDDMIETMMIYSSTANIPDSVLCGIPPFRSPHFTASAVSIVGGGNIMMPGEISLAHNGVLFLDEMPEFSRNVLESLRQPIEKKVVDIARASYHGQYKCDFQLIGAMNPCRCANVNQIDTFCKKGIACTQSYMAKISGPILDRFDLTINLLPVTTDELLFKSTEESSKDIFKRVERAIEFVKSQGRGKAASLCNEYFKGDNVFEDGCVELLAKLNKKNNNSARGYFRLLKVARTIADMEQSQLIKQNHILEAYQFRK